MKRVSAKKTVHFVKVHAPFEILCCYAETLSFRAPLQAYPYTSENWSANFIEELRIENFLDQQLPRYPTNYYTCQFRTSKLNRFLGSENRATFFNDSQRSRIVWEILCETAFGQRRRAQVGIERLIDEGVFTAAYPLHCGPYEVTGDENDAKFNDRQILYNFWARWGLMWKYQPLDHVREYFGEQIGFYFAWLGFYTAWLLPASILGVLVFLYGAFSAFTDVKSDEICQSNATMCPQCSTCSPWFFNSTCIFARVSYTVDNTGTVFYAVFISIWGKSFANQTNKNL